MPELAEVETVCRLVKRKLKGHRFTKVIVDADDRYLFAFAKPAAVRKALEGAKVTGVGRKGKYFWIELDRKPWPIFHLGMSGNVAIVDPRAKAEVEGVWEGAKLWRESAQDFQKKVRFARLKVEAERGLEFIFLDPRRFGRMWLADDPWTHPRIKQLGFDPLLDFPTPKALAAKLAKRKKAIKAVLLDQALFAGIGNWLADEILFQARLSPHHLASKLTPAQTKALRASLLKVVKKAVAVHADYERFPKTWLFHHRWGKSKTAKTSRGLKIIHQEVGGRTTAWVPDWQR